MAELDSREWREFMNARNELEAANEYHISLIAKYTADTARPGEPMKLITQAVKDEIEAAENRLEFARERLRLAQRRVQ